VVEGGDSALSVTEYSEEKTERRRDGERGREKERLFDLLLETVSEPVEAGLKAIAVHGASGLDVPLMIFDLLHLEARSDLSRGESVGNVLLVGVY